MEKTPGKESEHSGTIKGAGFREKILRTAKRAAKQIPFVEEIIAAYYCSLDPRTPSKAKAVMMGALAYFVLPVDMIPDFILAFGFTDDLAVITTAMAAIGPHVSDAHREAAGRALDEGKQQS